MGVVWQRIWGRREVIAYALTFGFVGAFLIGQVTNNPIISSEQFATVFSMVIAFYFGTRANNQPVQK